MMSASRRRSNGASPLVNPQRQIIFFFTKATSSPAIAATKGLNPKSSPNLTSPNSIITPSPLGSKPKSNPSPSPSSVVTPPNAAAAYGGEVVGKRIKVFWPMDSTWYQGYVKLFDNDTGRHLLHYDDGEEEIVDLRNEKIEWLPPTQESTATKFKRLRRGGPLSTAEPPLQQEEESIDDDDDSVDDEDWGKNVVEEEVMELEDEEEVHPISKSKSKSKPAAKRKMMMMTGGGASSGSVKKKTKSNNNNGDDVATLACKLNFNEPTTTSSRKHEGCY